MTPPALAWTEAWFRWIAAASWQLALLAIIVGVVTWAARRASPRWRHGLWLLVLVKVFVPPSLTAIWGVGVWGVAPIWQRAEDTTVGAELASAWSAELGDAEAAPAEGHGAASEATPSAAETSLSARLFLAWAAGCVLVFGAAVFHYASLCRATRRMRLIDEGPLRVELERLALDLGQPRTPDLYASETAGSPFLFGVLRPAIVAPRELLDQDSVAARAVLLHEMHHWRRRDPWIGWLQVVAQAMFWFHPLVWWANARLRAERETACDDAVLRTGALLAADYAETLLRILTLARGRSLVTGAMAVVFERGADLQTRLEAIMNFQPDQRRFNGLSRLALVAFALVFLPMGMPAGTKTALADDAGEAASQAAQEDEVTSPKEAPPNFVSTPEAGATDVDPALKEIVVTFDRDMEKGMSWTGGPENFPSPDETRQAEWRDARTCVLPVILKRGAYYRVGINSTSHQNFRSADGVPARPAAIAFTTAGASPALVRRLRAPELVEAEPAQEARDVDPTTKFLRVTFDMPMGAGMSWTGLVPVAEGQRARWSRDARTCILPVTLEPVKTYKIGLNSPSHINFQSKWAVPLEAVRYEFTTSGEAEATVSDESESDEPTIVAMTPENGASDVDPGLKAIRVTFDRPMAAGFSWTGGGPEFPTAPPGKKPSWSRDRRSCTLPVALEPNHTYRLGLNSPSFKNFASADGVPLAPVVYEFKTGP